MSESRTVLIVGATGRVGSIVTRFALEQGHKVHVYVRSKPKLIKMLGEETVSQLTGVHTGGSLSGDASAIKTLADVLRQVQPQAILSLVGAPDLKVVSTVNTDAATTLVGALNEAALPTATRLIVLSGSGLLPADPEHCLATDTMVYESPESPIAKWLTNCCNDMKGAVIRIMACPHAWTLITPGHIPEGLFRYFPIFGMTGVFGRSRQYTVSLERHLPRNLISQEDLADCFVSAIEHDDWIRHRVMPSYT